VYEIFTPVPSRELSLSFVHTYEQGVAEHVDEVPSNVTGDPTTGFDGEYVNAATGPGDEAGVVKLESQPKLVP